MAACPVCPSKLIQLQVIILTTASLIEALAHIFFGKGLQCADIFSYNNIKFYIHVYIYII
jgi:hypothetical protein